MKLNADLTRRASCNIHDIEWENSPANGVQRLRLERDESHPPVERVTTVVRFAANSSFNRHVHHGGEELLVLEGVFSDQHADYPAGYYVRNPKGTGHAPHSDAGCIILVKLWQMRADDQLQLAINTHDESLWEPAKSGEQILRLFDADYESVCMLQWPGGLQLPETEFAAGVEYFILQGGFSDDLGSYAGGSWLRLPAGSKQSIRVTEDCLLFRKSAHLLNPVSYE